MGRPALYISRTRQEKPPLSLPVSVVADSVTSAADHVRHLSLNLVPRIVGLPFHLWQCIRRSFYKDPFCSIWCERLVITELIGSLKLGNIWVFTAYFWSSLAYESAVKNQTLPMLRLPISSGDQQSPLFLHMFDRWSSVHPMSCCWYDMGHQL